MPILVGGHHGVHLQTLSTALRRLDTVGAMPLVPNNGKLYIDLASEAGVAELVSVARSLDPEKVARFATGDYRTAADIGDHLLYLSATHPEWFAPYRDLAVTELPTRLPMDLATAAILLPGTSNAAIERLCDRLAEAPSDWGTLSLLAGANDPTGMEVLADVTRTHGSMEWLNRMGVHVGDSHPAIWRFTPHRYAIVVPARDAESTDGPVGAPIADVAVDPQGLITWHYLSLRPAAVEGLPAWPSEYVHLVSPRTCWFTLHCNVLPDGRYTEPEVDDEGEPFDSGMHEAEADPPPRTTAALHRYDESLVYRNGHVHLTPSVAGDAGGPPVGIYPNPVCPDCGVLMFHVATVRTDIREYGEGFRSGFVCEACQRAAVTGTNWN